VSDAWQEMADGVRLCSRIWTPAGQGPWPVLVMRQPYGRAIASTITYAHPRWYAGHGYAVVVQDCRGTWQGRQVVDDYAHHPSEVDATLATARLMVSSGRSTLPEPPQRLLAIFQPHRYSRTAEFLEPFAQALTQADAVILAPLYAAGEDPSPASPVRPWRRRLGASNPICRWPSPPASTSSPMRWWSAAKRATWCWQWGPAM